MPDLLEDALPLTAIGDAEPSTELEVGECFAPFIPPAPPAPAPAPEPKRRTLADLSDEILPRKSLVIPAPADPTAETGTSTSSEAESTGDTDAPVTEPGEILPALVAAPPLPAPRRATALEIFTWIKGCLLAQTHLPEDVAELLSFWTISTWFQDALTILPCLIITGPAHDGGSLLHVLGDLCRRPALLAGFQRSHLGVLRWGCGTNLVSEPNLDKRTAALLSSLTDRRFLVVEGGSLTHCSKSTAIYAGENPTTHKIQHSIHIHISTTSAAPPARPEWLWKTTERVPVHLAQYREKHLGHIRQWTIIPSSVCSETAATAAALARCIVDAPALQNKVIALLKTQDQRRRFEMSDTIEAVVLEAILALSRDGRESAYVREIAEEVNHRLEARGETVRLSPEKVGHQLKKLGLRTRPLSQAGNGLTFDKTTVAEIQQLAVMHGMEDMPAAV